ncbi:MAG TPA: class I fructose-bisphosphate aldolase [Methylococcaceae bacterium]|nr:class I fructose-bisphosphate aldolase [Methylococcaceae bacterium]
MQTEDELQATIAAMVQPGKGILAADESHPTIGKRFAAVGVESTPENRRAYRSLLFTTSGIGEFLSAVILFEETLGQQAEDGTPLPEVLSRQGIVPGIKVDKGTLPLAGAPGDTVTQGLDGLAERLKTYKAQGARFAKWREVYAIGPHNPTCLGIEANAEVLARYAAVCQEEGIVPIVEPEVLIDGDHTLERCAEVTEAVLHAVFHALHRHRAVLEYTVLKPSMVLPGKETPPKASPVQVAEATLKILRRTVPAALPSINFLSGGQTPAEATANLNAMNAMHALAPLAPWELSFSYARALQQETMSAWQGKAENRAAAQQAFYRRAQLTGLARLGKYTAEMESGGS